MKYFRHLLSGAFFAFFLLFFTLNTAHATHFRGGSITWTIPNPAGAPRTVQFKIKEAWRRSAYGSPNVGSVISTTSFIPGGGSPSSYTVNLTVTSVNASEDWVFGEATITHTYPGVGVFTAYTSSCCRISTLLDGNNDLGHRVETIVNLNYAGNESPTISLPVIVNVPDNVASFTLNLGTFAFDVNGDPMTYRFSTPAESGLSVNPPSAGGMNIDGSGVLHWNTTSASFSPGQLRGVSIVVEDRVGTTAGAIKSKITTDFIFRIVNSSLPPVFSYGPTPSNGSLFTIAPGTPLSFTVQGDDPDAAAPEGTVTLNATGLPPGSTMTPVLPALGASAGLGVVSSVFNWTPTLAQVGTYNVSFFLQDGLGIQTITSLVIVVSTAPTFDIGPTPGNQSYYCRAPGQSESHTIRASDVDPLDQVTLTAAIVAAPPTPSPPPVPGGLAFAASLSPNMTFTPALPAGPGNPVSTVMSWNFQPSDFGIHIVQYTATDQGGKTSTLSHYFIVDSDPSFTSSPVLVAQVGVPYTYNITATDPDIPQGDALGFAPATYPYVTIPSWLTLTDNGNGTATLSGTPTLANAGPNNVKIELHDRTTHFNHLHCSWQFQTFTILVSQCSDPLPAAVEGCGMSIADMDNTPAPNDYTNYGATLVSGGMISKTYRIENPGPNTLTFTGPTPVTVSPAGEFTVTGQPAASVAPGDETSFTIKFDPSTVGAHAATVSIANDICPGNPHTFDITGNGSVDPTIFVSGNSNYIANRAPGVSPANDTDFGMVAIPNMVSHTFTIENILNGLSLQLDGLPLVSVAGAHAGDFSVTQPGSASIGGGSSANFQVKFTPSAPGNRTAQIVITHNDLPDNPFVFTVQGVGQ